ncbi:MAG TPA: hypothetical protein VHE78_02970 [Gemmatimonadaceae bacterium]|nr:hypothetical protein [Gemmatimonadaceae bacterium]
MMRPATALLGARGSATRSGLLWMAAAAMLAAACQATEKPAGSPPPPASVTIHANDFAFDAPMEISAGVEIGPGSGNPRRIGHPPIPI